MNQPFGRVVIWHLSQGYAVVGIRRGPSAERIGNYHPTETQAREAARFVPRKRPQIAFKDMRVPS